MLSGGAGILVLESEDQTQRRGVTPLLEIFGFGANSTSHDPVLPEPDGASATRCMELALADANLDPVDVDVLNAHATGNADRRPR